MAKKKKALTTFEGGEGATAAVSEKKAQNTAPRKPDPAWAQMQKERKDKRDKRKRRPNEDISWQGYKK